MPILFKCDECKTPGMVPDGSEGQNYTCNKCGHVGIIPSSSSEECILVYKDGYPNDGMPFDREDFANKVSERFFKGSDLVKVNGIWVPINTVCEVPPTPEPPPPNGPEIATEFSELPPMPGVYVEKTPLKSGKSHWHIYAAVAVVALMALLASAYFMFLNPNRNGKGNGAYVLVLNPDSRAYTAELNGMTLELPANGRCLFQNMHSAIPGKRKLNIMAGGEIAYAVQVPVYPELDVVVSPAGKIKFDTYKTTSQSQNCISQQLLNAIQKEISSLADPVALSGMESHLHDTGMGLHGNSLDDEIYTSEQYSFAKMDIERSAEYINNSGNNASDGKTLLVQGKITLEFPDVSFDFSPEDKNSSFAFAMPEEELPPKMLQEAFAKFQSEAEPEKVIRILSSKQSIKLNVSYAADGGDMMAEGSFPGELSAAGHKYTGNWMYGAKLYANGEKRGKWEWSWKFDGKRVTKYNTANPPHISLEYKSNVGDVTYDISGDGKP